MVSLKGFTGFPQQGVDFLAQLKINNSKSWFQEHKPEYEKYLQTPARQFVLDMGHRLRELSPELNYDPRTDKSIFRIYRDVRFSKDKTPYKTHLAIWFWQGERKKLENSGYYFHLEPDSILLAVGLHTFPSDILLKYREAVADDKSGKQLIDAVEQIGSKGYDTSAEMYKRVPRDYPQDHPRSHFLKYKGFGAMARFPLPQETFSDSLLDFCFQKYQEMFPVHDWLVKNVVP